MNPSLGGLFLVSLLIVPGFTHYMVARAVRTSEDDSPFEPTIFLTSLGLTAGLVSIEVLAVGVAAHFADELATRATALFRDGFAEFAATHPSLVLVGLPVVFLTNTILLGVLGAIDPMNWVAQKLLD